MKINFEIVVKDVLYATLLLHSLAIVLMTSVVYRLYSKFIIFKVVCNSTSVLPLPAYKKLPVMNSDRRFSLSKEIRR